MQNSKIKWKRWDQKSLEEAKKKNKVLFLVSFYKNCFWCKRLFEEILKESKVIEALDKNFICILIDKDENLDIDKHFQRVSKILNSQEETWPLLIFLTPEKFPIYLQSNFKDSKEFLLILESVLKRFFSQKDQIIKQTKEIENLLAPKSKILATKITDDLIKIASFQLVSNFDKEKGFFKEEKKLLRISALEFALELYKVSKEKSLKEIVEVSFEKIYYSFLYDKIEGGFFRASPKDFTTPIYEKNSLLNAQILDLLLEMYQVFGKEKYLNIAKEIADFFINQMQENNLFFNSIFQKSSQEYFLFDYNKLTKVFEEKGFKNPDILVEKLGIKKDFPKNSIKFSKELENNKEIKKALEILKDLRKTKKELKSFEIDKRVFATTNGFVIKTLFKLSKIDSSYLENSKRSLNHLRNFVGKGSIIFHLKEPFEIEGFLIDYAYMSLSMIEAYKTTQDEIYLKFAKDLLNEAIKRFYKNGRWSLGGKEFFELADDQDRIFPSEVGVILEALIALRDLEDPIYDKFIQKTFAVFSYNLMRNPISRAKLAKLAICDLKGKNFF